MSDDPGGGASRTTDPAAGSSAATDVSLREYFNEKIGADRKLNRDRFVFAAALGGVIWFFVERHLSDLNHENARVARVSEASVSSDTYDANEKQRQSEASKLDERLKGYDEKFTQAITRDDLNRETKVEHRAVMGSGWQVVGGIVGLIFLVLALYAALHTARPVTNTPTPTQTVTVTTP